MSAAPELSADEQATVARFELGNDAPESFRWRMVEAMADAADSLGLSPGYYYADALAAAAIAALDPS